MATQTPNRPAFSPAEGMTELFDAIACLDERVRRQALPAVPRQQQPDRPNSETGCYVEVQGVGERLLVPLGPGVTHIGRGLAADLRLDEDSVSRRHAILLYRRSGSRILDDRSSNGTFVNGRRVTQADLRNGDVLVLGRVVLRYLES
ncbi:MAG: FHA domain-containing protein [Solirubrobacteraceae bacterium]